MGAGVLTKPGASKLDPMNIFNGAILQCAEAVTLGMPFEVWKTRMARFRTESTLQALGAVYGRGGLAGFWQGTSLKMVESASKGAILLFSKEGIFDICRKMDLSPTSSGFLAGAGGGVCQTVVMGPCTFLITCLVTDANKNASVAQKVSSVWMREGVRGFYPGGSAIAFRQATNWASRQGFTELFRSQLLKFKARRMDSAAALKASENSSLTGNTVTEVYKHALTDVKLNKREEILAGTLGGAISTWNQPFEVARVYMQAAANEGRPRQNIVAVFRTIVKTDGFRALFAGIIPRIGLGVWQTLFMVTGAKFIRDLLK